MYDYKEACPISMAASVLCERWTLQIIRDLFFGSTRHSEIQLRWASEGMTDKQNTAWGLVRDFAGRIDIDEISSGNTSIELHLTDVQESPTRYIHVQGSKTQVCDTDLSFEVDVRITSTPDVMTRIWYGEIDMASAMNDKRMKVNAPPPTAGGSGVGYASARSRATIRASFHGARQATGSAKVRCPSVRHFRPSTRTDCLPGLLNAPSTSPPGPADC
jgi:hypothetical protein